MKILVVDDDAEIRVGLKRLLEDNGHDNVMTARSVTEALGLIKRPVNVVEWQVELIITALDMGHGTDGLDLIKKAGAKRLKAKFWLVSAGMNEKIASLAKEFGAEQAIDKSALLIALKEKGLIT
jgi:CheY-like chemotaxis protein